MQRFSIQVSTEGETEIVNLSPELARQIHSFEGDGLVHLFAVGSTCALTTLEYEPGLVKHDVKAVLDKLIPPDAAYQHEATWNDDNGHSHIRAALIGPSLTVPFANGRILTGEYQQVVLIDLDTRARRRTVICTVIV